MIELHSIVKKYNENTDNETTVFDDFNLSVKKGDFITVVGSNGSGKTTMLNLINGTIMPSSGQIILDGEDITRKKEYLRAKRIGRVFQDPMKNVASEMTIAENLALAENKGKRYGLSAALSTEKIARYKELVSGLGLGVEEKMGVKMGLLSGGQRQSIALLMATLTPIDILILDEHTAALDPKTADTIMAITDRIVKEKQLTTVMVTHNLRYACEYGNRIIMMDKGKIILDKSGEEKENTRIEDLLHLFNSISIECGN